MPFLFLSELSNCINRADDIEIKYEFWKFRRLLSVDGKEGTMVSDEQIRIFFP
jgi:hypothetical protein